MARTHTGSHAGQTFRLLDGWELSSDIGCDFIFLDGVVQAWEITGGDVLKAVIDEIVHRFLEVDLVAIKAQTHATLTCLRAILRYAVAADLPTLIPEVETRYCLYRERAWTEDFANYNWFERPEWTEPCAIVDSFMVAVGLWQVTGQAEYLADAHLIYFNALGHAQRSNGGFGCDTCVGAAGPFIQISVPEAFWCCTMRGGEGLARAIEYSYFTEEDKIFVPFFHESEAALATGGGRVHLRQSTSYPLEGRVRLDVLEQTGKALRLRLFRPPWAAQPTVTINGLPRQVVEQRGFIEIDEPLNAGDVIEYQFDLLLQEAATVNRFSVAGYGSLRHGPLLLACESSSEVSVKEVPKTVSPDAHYRLPDGTVLAPINDAIAREQMDKETYRRQILFKRTD